jgi:hypothetical protein
VIGGSALRSRINIKRVCISNLLMATCGLIVSLLLACPTYAVEQKFYCKVINDERSRYIFIVDIDLGTVRWDVEEMKSSVSRDTISNVSISPEIIKFNIKDATLEPRIPGQILSTYLWNIMRSDGTFKTFYVSFNGSLVPWIYGECAPKPYHP